jgi:hypothetical protein
VLLRAWATLVARAREVVLSGKQLVMENYIGVSWILYY